MRYNVFGKFSFSSKTQTLLCESYQRCRFCSDTPLGAEAVTVDLRRQQELAILAIVKASECEAFQDATDVTIMSMETSVTEA